MHLNVLPDPEPPENPLSESPWSLHYSSTSRYILGTTTDPVPQDPDESSTIRVPYYAYIHGQIALSLSPFSCPWDSGLAGIAVLPSSENLYSSHKAALADLSILLTSFTAYLNGESWGFTITKNDPKDNPDTPVLDSCWGYLLREDAEADGEAALLAHTKETPKDDI